MRSAIGGTAQIPVTFYDMTVERPHGFASGHYFLFPTLDERGKTMVYGPYDSRRLAAVACDTILREEIAPRIFGE